MLDSLEKTLPRDSYLSEAHFEREYAAIFDAGWVCVGRGEGLTQAGDYLAIRLNTQSLLVVKTETGALKAFYNVCRHRGTELVPLKDPGPITGQFQHSIICPYHAWSYHLDGRLRGTPHLAVHTDGVSLHALTLAQWGGFIFIRLDPGNDDPLRSTLGHGVERLQRYPLQDLQVGAAITYEVAANWKVIVENYNECYHCGPVHPELCELVPAFRRGGSDLEWDEGVPHREGTNTFTASGTTLRNPFPGLSEIEKTHHKGELFYPNLMLSLSMDHVAAFYLWPQGPGMTRIQCDFLFHPDAMAKPDFDGSDAIDFWDLVNQQDWQICESVQRGMQNRVFQHGYYAPMEDYSLDIRHYVRSKLGEE
ncbi:MAG: aromatic ring-hydroxylating dioxygenase subunit alpha [Luminiphilus sp.]|nr:aromatic ring-hydroxylating dioxygenase subunit alpha [Luminiphilus sp.]